MRRQINECLLIKNSSARVMNGKKMYNRCILPDSTLEERLKKGKKKDFGRKASPVNKKEENQTKMSEDKI